MHILKKADVLGLDDRVSSVARHGALCHNRYMHMSNSTEYDDRDSRTGLTRRIQLTFIHTLDN